MTPAEAAEALQVNPHTIRRWCAAHAVHLSPDANPDRNAPRRLTARDLEVLREVQRLRAQGLQAEAINARLSALTFASVEESESNVRESGSQQAAQATQTAQGAFMPPMLIDSLHQRVDALQRHIDRVERSQRDRAMLFVAGVAVGLVAGILLLLAAYLLANIGA